MGSIKLKDLSFFIFYLLFLSLLAGCNSTDDSFNQEAKQNSRICPQCNMPLPNSNLHTCKFTKNGKNYYFDDPGCLILWSKENSIDIDKEKVKIFSNDTNRYIDAKSAYYTINEKTPMSYGFTAYENVKENSIDFAEVRLRMLRGEHMANPKIRKQILGY